MTKFLPKAIALAVSLGAAASAHATSVNHDGLGQVLLYPAYTVQQGNDTAISVTNTTGQIKAVKVRFLEGMNSQEVLDFNLYLSPYDVWNGVVVRTEAGAKLVTQDKSCTVPTIPANGQDFVAFQYTGAFNGAGKGGPQGTDRTRIGHVEVIEMGNIAETVAITSTVTAAQAIVHNSAGVPGNCAVVANAFKTGGKWVTNPNLDVTIPTGGLYGVGTITNVNEGTQIGYDATALANFAPAALHTLPGNIQPSLASGVGFATFSDGSALGFAANPGPSVDAVSAVLAKTELNNEFAVGAGVNAKTDWVVTFPTKYAYVNNGVTGTGATAVTNPALRPFTNAWSAAPVNNVAGSSCQPVALGYFNREEATVTSDIGFSPLPPQGVTSLCFETNIISFSGSNILAGDADYVHFNFPVSFDAGWAYMGFTNAANVIVGANGTVNTAVNPQTFAGAAGTRNVSGLPAIGFSMLKVSNGVLPNNVLSNYSSAWDHKAEVTISAVIP